jgi:hypothetical protein
MTGNPEAIPDQKSSSGSFTRLSNDKRPDGQKTSEWLTLLPRLKGGRRDGTHSQIEAEAGS